MMVRVLRIVPAFMCRVAIALIYYSCQLGAALAQNDHTEETIFILEEATRIATERWFPPVDAKKAVVLAEIAARWEKVGRHENANDLFQKAIAAVASFTKSESGCSPRAILRSRHAVDLMAIAKLQRVVGHEEGARDTVKHVSHLLEQMSENDSSSSKKRGRSCGNPFENFELELQLAQLHWQVGDLDYVARSAEAFKGKLNYPRYIIQ